MKDELPILKRFIECLLPITACNLHCDYCYVIQEDRREMKQSEFDYSFDVMEKALNKDRFGGVCYFSICGAGETLLQKNIVEIISIFLRNGHYINLTTNGTVTASFIKIVESFTKEELERINFSFSLHYLELKRLNLVNKFFENVRRVREAGCSYVIQLNLYDGYIPVLEEIKSLCIKEVGALPQIALTRTEPDKGIDNKTTIMSNLTFDDYQKTVESFASPLFKFTCDNFMVQRKEFCYAGDWSATLNLQTGILKKCYFMSHGQNIFKNPNEKINFEAIGNNCKSSYCSNSSHFLSLGTIPELKCPTYEQLRNRPNADWYSERMRRFLSQRLFENNKEYSNGKKNIVNVKNKIFLGTSDGLHKFKVKLYRVLKGK